MLHITAKIYIRWWVILATGDNKLDYLIKAFKGSSDKKMS